MGVLRQIEPVSGFIGAVSSYEISVELRGQSYKWWMY